MEAARSRRSVDGEIVYGDLKPGVLWDGVFYGWSGYAKANREIVSRVSNSLYVETSHSIFVHWDECACKEKFDSRPKFAVAKDTPYLRFFGPDLPGGKPNKYSICWTMIETEVVHPDMVKLLEKNFDEVWTPTHWNAEAFVRSGLERPVRVMPLGVDPIIYRPRLADPLPECKLMSTERAGKMEIPSGFLFITVGLPSLRKGFDVLIKAFEAAFKKDKDAGLVVATTFCRPEDAVFAPDPSLSSRIWLLEGSYGEHPMAKLYNACNAYVSASRGEGWNLPGCEAAACGLPVIVPDSTAHPEVFGEHAFFFHTNGVGRCQGVEGVSPWYVGMPFSVFDDRSIRELSHVMRLVRKGGDEITSKRVNLRARMANEWTWDNAAANVARRLMDLQQ